MNLFRIRRSKTLRRKFRGKKRYFRKVFHDAQKFSITPQPDDWWDFWHYHSDWPGWGNLSSRFRMEHIRALAVVFNKICDARRLFAIPFQTFIKLDGGDAGRDATFLHTPSPGSSCNFPLKISNIEWGVSDLDPILPELFPGRTMRVGREIEVDEDEDPPREKMHYYLYSPDVGASLE